MTATPLVKAPLAFLSRPRLWRRERQYLKWSRPTTAAPSPTSWLNIDVLVCYFPLEVSEPQMFRAAIGAAAPLGVCLSFSGPTSDFFFNDSCVCQWMCEWLWVRICTVFGWLVDVLLVDFFKVCCMVYISALVLYSVKLHWTLDRAAKTGCMNSEWLVALLPGLTGTRHWPMMTGAFSNTDQWGQCNIIKQLSVLSFWSISLAYLSSYRTKCSLSHFDIFYTLSSVTSIR